MPTTELDPAALELQKAIARPAEPLPEHANTKTKTKKAGTTTRKPLSAVKKLNDKSKEELISDLVKALQDKGEFSPAEFEKHTKIAASTVHKWAAGDTAPLASTLEVFRRYCRFNDKAFAGYMRNSVSLEDLLEQRDALRQQALPDKVVLDFKTLKLEDQLAVLTKISAIIKESVEESQNSVHKTIAALHQQVEALENEVEEYKPKIEYLELDDRSATKLKNLIRSNLFMHGKTEQDLVKKGVPGALLRAILENTGDLFPKSDYDVLAQNLSMALAWTDNLMPSIDPATYHANADELIKELKN